MTQAAMPAVEMLGVDKSFGPVVALEDVRFSVTAGEVHALLGENGAGKTTLMNILSGLYQADSGVIRVGGQEVQVRSPRDAVARGVGMVSQHFELVDALSGCDNVLLGVKSRWWRLERSRHRASINGLAQRYGLKVDLETPIGELEIGDQQKIEILRILYAGTRILILDEPTTHLTPGEVERLFKGVRQLAEDGITVILIAHKLHQVLTVADRVTVLRRGRLAGVLEKGALDEKAIVEMMLGKQARASVGAPRHRSGARRTLLELESCTSVAVPPAIRLRGVSFGLSAGELVGVAGVAGNGQRELVQLIAGLIPIQSGGMRLDNRPIGRASVAERLRAGIAVLPGDRMREGVLPSAPVYESYALGLHRLWEEPRWTRRLLRERAREMAEAVALRPANVDAPTADLSGGNIQKLLVARAFASVSRSLVGVLVASNPTSGLDVAATSFVHTQLLRMCEEGGSVLLISEDLDELLALCDRILVLYSGRIAAEFEGPSYDRMEIGARMVGSRG
jgi:ABC-type uncharacterized transport system ATPase subunit